MKTPKDRTSMEAGRRLDSSTGSAGSSGAAGTRDADASPRTAAPVLGADVQAWLDQAIAPEPVDAAVQARVKKRLLRRIAEESTSQHLTIAAAAGAWQPFGPGVTMKVLHHDGGCMSYLLRLAPGAALPPHRHPVDEECLVLEGEMHIGDIVIGAGGYHRGRQGVLHDRLTSPGGALIFLRGAVPEAELAL
jgi:anti-sigma factor ChrR (cupin superfamily)